jgi:hypothetical protein
MKIDKSSRTVYWTDHGMIMRSDLDGAFLDTIQSGLTRPYGLAIDERQDLIFWTDVDEEAIYRSKLDGTEKELIVSDDIRAPLDITVDTLNDKLIWLDRSGRKIKRSNLDGTGAEQLISAFTPTAARIDYEQEKIYWVQNQTGEIYKADLDGTNVELILTIPIINAIADISLDLANDRIFLAFRTGFNSGEIRSVDLTTQEMTIHVGEGIFVPLSVHYDRENNEVYWTDSGALIWAVQKISLETGKITRIITSDASSKESIIYRDSILFFSDFYGVNYYDFAKRQKVRVEPSGRVEYITADSSKNIYWVNVFDDNIYRYNFSEKTLDSLARHPAFRAWGKIEWLRDNSLYILDNAGIFRYYIDENRLETVAGAMSALTFAIDDAADIIYLSGSHQNERIRAIDKFGNGISFSITDGFDYVSDMARHDRYLYLTRKSVNASGTLFPGGLVRIDLEGNSVETLVDSTNFNCIYIESPVFKDLSLSTSVENHRFALNNTLKIFPNPTTGTFWLQATLPEEVEEIQVLNAFGQIIWRKTGQIDRAGLTIRLSQPAGYYYVRAKVDGNDYVIPLVIH